MIKLLHRSSERTKHKIAKFLVYNYQGDQNDDAVVICNYLFLQKFLVRPYIERIHHSPAFIYITQ